MAKIAFTPVVGDARGKAGRSVFTRSKSGAVIRVRVKGMNPRTSGQTSVRNFMAAAARQFKAFVSDTVTAWQNYANSITRHNAVSGQAYHPSAINAYTQLAVPYMLENAGGTPPDTPPAAPFTGDGATVTAAGGAGKVTFTASEANGTDVKTVMLAKALASANRVAAVKSLKRMGSFAATALALTHDLALTPGWYAIGYKEVLTTTGQETLPVLIGYYEAT